MKNLIKTRIDRHFSHIYCLTIAEIEKALPMLGFDVWLACQNVKVSENNANQTLDNYIKYINDYFLYSEHYFFRHFSSLRLAHYKLFLSDYYYEEFQKLHTKYVSEIDYTKEMLIRTATHKVNIIAEFYNQEMH